MLPARDRELLLDELDRLWTRRLERDGPAAARRWYRREVQAFATRWPAERLRLQSTTWGSDMIDGLRQLHRTIRGLWRVPGFTTVAVLTLALGIGANALIFGLVDRALLRPLPLPEPDRIVSVLDGWGTNLATVDILDRRMTSVSAIGGVLDATGRTFEPADGPARRVTVAQATPAFFEALGVRPMVGRLFRTEESEPGRGRVALASADFWRTALGGASAASVASVASVASAPGAAPSERVAASEPGAAPSERGAASESERGADLQLEVVLDGVRYAVVGVLPEGFDVPSARNDLFVPAIIDADDPGALWGYGAYGAVARLAPGATTEQALAELQSLEEEVRLANPLWTPNPGMWSDAQVVSLRESRSRWVRTPLLILLAAVGVVLLVVCANVANLLLSRGLSRSRDLAVRAALGAGRGRLAREQLMEAGVLAAAGTGVGLLLASAGMVAIRPLLPPELPGAAHAVGLDLRVVAVTGGLALVTALLAGALPALRSARRAPAVGLREAGRGGSVGRGRRRTTRGLVASQLAAAVVLVVSAGLLSRSLMALNRVDPGFEIDRRITARVDLAPGLPGDAAARALVLDDLQRALVSDPELRGVALASTIPFGSENEFVATFIPGITDDPNALPTARHHRVSPSFFDVTGIEVLRGRGFTDADRVGSPLVAVVDETFVRTLFGGEDPIGRIVRYPWRGAPDIEIVGVVGSTRHGDLASERDATYYVPMAQMGFGLLGHAVVVAESGDDPAVAMGALMRRVRDMDDRMAVSDLLTYDERLAASLMGTRLMATLLMLFAGTALALGCVGVYGVAAFSVRERFREIGVRMAMGASAEGIRREVLREGLLMAVPGGVLGLGIALFATRALDGLLFGVAPIDPLTFLAVPVVLGAAALLAVYVPARRATKVDPATVLRGDG